MKTESIYGDIYELINNNGTLSYKALFENEATRKTFNKIMNSLIEFQKEYFLTGDIYKLNQVTLLDISKKTKIEKTMVTKCLKNIFIKVPFQTEPILIRNLFSEGFEDLTGKSISSIIIMHELKKTIEAEDTNKPLSNLKLAIKIKEDLNLKKLSTRTISKYRMKLNIPVSRFRKIKNI